MLSPALQYLKQFPSFLVYKLVPSASRLGKTDKIPCDFSTGKCPVDPHDPKHWTDAATAEATAAAWGEGYGVGFVITPETKLFCLDADSCLMPDRQWHPLVGKLRAALPRAGVEVSVSGRALHTWGRYEGPEPAHSKRAMVEGVDLELYTSKRFIALGDQTSAVGDAGADCTTELQQLIETYFPPNGATADEAGWSEGHELGWKLPEDDELIQRAMNFSDARAAFGDKASFADLWTRNVSKLSKAFPDGGGRDYDESAADMALASKLAWLTGNDCPRIERLMWKSALVRDKWETHKTYLCGFTIPRALKLDDDFYNPNYREEAAQRRQEALAATAGAPDAAITPSDAITIGSVDLKGIEASLLQQKTQDSVALVFELKQAGKLLFNHSRGQWMEWDGTRWKFETTQKAFDFARNLARSLNFGGASSMGSSSFCGGVEKFSQASRTFAVEGEKFDCDNYLLNTPAGTIDLRTGKMRAHDPADLITKCTAAAPDAERDGASFRKFMMDITDGDEEMVRFHQVSLGACLSGAIEDHWMLFWVGEGRNGKNTLGDLVEEVMGDYARTIRTSTLMSKSHQSHPEELANLQGIRMAISSEVNDGDHWDESRIKQVTGDAKISARFMYGSSFTYLRTHKHIVYGNHRPQLRSTDSAIKSRIKIVPFKVSFRGREDKDLSRRLREERGYVLQWLIAGHQQWLEAGKRLPACAAAEAESADYFASQSTPEMWLEECTEAADPISQMTSQCPRSGDLYRSYAEWKKNRGEQPLSQTRWAETMQKKFQKVKSVAGFHYKGLRIRPLQYGGPPFPLVPLPPGVTLSN